MTLKTIQRGNTLGQMVAAYNRENKTSLTVDQVAKANGLVDANKIIAGTKLIFPDAFESKAKQSVIQNGDNKPLVRNGVNERVEVKGDSKPELITTSDAKISNEIQQRPLEKMPSRNADTFQKPVAKTDQPVVATNDAKISTNVQQRPLEKLPQKPVVKTPVVPQKPVVKTETPVITQKPVAKTETPVITQKPVVKTETPVITQKPVAKTETPVITQKPVVKTETPVITQKPVAKTETPVITQKPVVKTETPVITQKPVAKTETPAIAQKPVVKTETPVVPQKTFEPLPPAFANKGGSDKMMQEVLDRGFAKGGYEQGLRWLQEMEGLKIDGRFGSQTEKHLGDEYKPVIQQLRAQRIAETKGQTAMAPLSPAQMKSLKAEMRAAQEKELNTSGDPERGMEAAVKVMQRRLANSNEPMSIDGRMKIDSTPEKTQTYESMVRVYGKTQANELTRYLREDLSSYGVD